MSIESSTEPGNVSSAIAKTRVSSYLASLPAIFQQDADAQGVSLIGRLLLAFEKIFSGLGDAKQAGLEEQLDRLHTYFDPLAAPQEFLPWLASWVALTLREDWNETERRRFISRIVPAYRKRGTKAGMIEVLKAYSGIGLDKDVGVEIVESTPSLQIGTTSTVGIDTQLGGELPPHYFRVRMYLSDPDDGVGLQRREEIARSIIDQEKPAHTYYDLTVQVPTMRISCSSPRIGINTILGSADPKLSTKLSPEQ